MIEGTFVEFSEKNDKDTSEKSGIELTGYSLVFFQVVEQVLANRKKEFLSRLMPNVLNACKRILEYCPGMSAFDGSWRRELSSFLSINDAERFVGDDFFSGMTWVFDQKLEAENLSVVQTEQILGTFFISSLMKLYEEIMIQCFFVKKLRKLAKQLKEQPLTNNAAGIKQGIGYISKIFTSKIEAKQLEIEILEEFKSIFQNLESKNNQAFVDLLTLFFLKPFVFEIMENVNFLIKNTDQLVSGIVPFMEGLEQSNVEQEISYPEGEVLEQSLAADLQVIETAFDTIIAALRFIKNERRIEIFEAKIFSEFKEKIQVSVKFEKVFQIHDEFDDIYQKKITENLNVILYEYCLVVHVSKFQNRNLHVFSKSVSQSAAIQQIIQETLKNLQSEGIQLQLQNVGALISKVLSPPEFPLYTLDISDKSKVKYRVHRLELFKDRESFAALLNTNPLVKALLLSQIPIAVVLQILRVDNDFKDVSTVMWLEPALGLIGFVCGVYALRNPKTLVNKPVRFLEALSTSSVVLSKCLGIAILAHTELFPKEGESGGIDIERFLKVIASGPIAIALLFWIYNSISPGFKEKHFPKKLRFVCDLINHFTIYFGLNQIISIDIVKIINRIEQVDFSTSLSRMLFEFLPGVPAVFFAHARVAPIRLCKKGGLYVNISETINTTVLYGFTLLLLTNLGIDLSLADNLPIEQMNFRRVFFPGLVFVSVAVMCRFANNFRKKYAGNPEIIIQQIIKEEGFQPMANDTFCLGGQSQPFLASDRVQMEQIDSDDEDNTIRLDYEQVEILKTEFNATEEFPEKSSAGAKMLLMLHDTIHKKKELSVNHRSTSRACCSCAIL